MKNWFSINISVLFIAIVCTLNCISRAAESVEFQRVDPNQVPAELMKLSSVTKANYEKIKTWQGNIIFQSAVVYRGQAAANLLRRHIVEPAKEPNKLIALQEPNELRTLSEGTVEFKIDLENDRIFTHMNRPQPMTYTDPDKERIYTSPLTGPTQHTRILTPEYQIESYPFRWAADGTIKERRAIKRVPGSQGNMTDSDPRKCFNVGSPIWDLLPQLSESLQQKKEKGIETYDIILEKGKTAGNNLVYRIQVIISGISHPISMFILKEEMGFNPAYVEDRGNNGLLVFQITTDFVEIDGIFLPSKRRVKQYEDFGLSRDENWTINNTQINAAIPDETFSVHGCGLKDGDRFVDEINNKTYIYKSEGKLAEVNEPE